jgi:hypothetical protein
VARAALAFALCIAATPAWSAESVHGEWRGSSICVNRQIAPACNDEQVHLKFELYRHQLSDKVHLDAQKLVDGKYETMFEIDLEAVGDAWVHAFATRAGARARWTFRALGDELDGRLVDEASGADVRKVTARRWKS